MFTLILAECVVLLHFLFVLFVVLGGLLVIWKRRLALLHIPCALYGAAIEFVGWVCPLTPLENWLRTQAGATTYTTGFVEHYLLPILYPEGLTRTVQFILGSIVVVVNGLLYGIAFRRRRT